MLSDLPKVHVIIKICAHEVCLGLKPRFACFITNPLSTTYWNDQEERRHLLWALEVMRP